MRLTPRLSRGLLVASFAAWLAAATANANPPTPIGFSFAHRDWEIACDNTRTCRAAGYQSDEEDLSVSLLLTREAGPGTPVQASVMLGDYGEEAEATSAPARGPGLLKLRVNGQALGTLPWSSQSGTFGLNPAQLQAVLKSLPRPRARIEFSHGRHVWRLSDQGAAAVLLKMDEFQGRLGTPTALARPGTQPESQALPPLPLPVVQAAKVPPTPDGPADERALGLSEQAKAGLRAELSQGDDETEQFPVDDEEGRLSFAPLGGGKWLVSKLCWRAAYNEGSCAWVVNARAPFQPQLVTNLASDIGEGEIWSSQKARGLGDCWHNQVWTWDGHSFVLTSDRITGLCKLVTPGGAWDLPTWVTKVMRP